MSISNQNKNVIENNNIYENLLYSVVVNGNILNYDMKYDWSIDEE